MKVYTSLEDNTHNGGMRAITVCPHLGNKYPKGNKYKGQFITQEDARSLTNVFRRRQIPSLLYDQQVEGFDPTTWPFCIPSTDSARLYLQPLNGHGNLHSNLVHVHRSNDDHENDFLYKTISKLIRERNPIRNTNGWDNVGLMAGVGEHLDWHGQHTDFVLKPQFRTRWSNEEEKLTMNKCGKIFEAQFRDKCVGYGLMIKHQKYLWPKECPDKVTDVPRCWTVSKNLGNELHNDDDADRSFAVWVNKNKKGQRQSKSWYLLFPEWGVAIELCEGTWISWNGSSCGHCTAVPDLADDDELLSLFCSIPKNLRNHLLRKKT